MKAAKILLFLFFTIALFACGGGGGGTSTPPIGSYNSVRLEALVTGSSTGIDPTNIFTSEQVTFRLTGLPDAGGSREVIPITGWTSTGSIGGTLNSGGTFVASATPGGGSGTVQITFQSETFRTTVRVVTRQAEVRGFCRLTDGRPAPRIGVHLLNNAGAIVATGLVASDGNIRISAPTSATRLNLDFSTVDPSALFYIRQFFFNGVDYSTVISGCTAPLPTLTSGAVTNLATNIVTYAISTGPPPPPPSGCS